MYPHYYLKISLFLIVLSFIFFGLHFSVFGNIENTIYYSAMSFCFIPINTLVVSIVFESGLKKRARQEKIGKMNMLVGLFFHEMGFAMLQILTRSDPNSSTAIKDISNPSHVRNAIINYNYTIDPNQLDHEALSKLVLSNRHLLTSLIGNENILEHESFADLLMALMHLKDEVYFRRHHGFRPEDIKHLSEDCQRLYHLLAMQWSDYLEHLRKSYPYLYEAAVATSPFVRRGQG